MKASSEDGEPTFELVEPVDVGLDAHSVDLDAVILWTDAMGLHRVELATIAKRQECGRSHSGPGDGRARLMRRTEPARLANSAS